MHAVPFSVSNVFAGLANCKGLLRQQHDLDLEYQVKDAVLGMIVGDVQRVQVPLEELVSVTLTRGWLGMTWIGVKIVIQVAKMETLKNFPGMSQGRIELS